MMADKTGLSEEEMEKIWGGNATPDMLPSTHNLKCGSQNLAVGNKILRDGKIFTLTSVAVEEGFCKYYFFCAKDRSIFSVTVTALEEQLNDCSFVSPY